MSDYFNVLPFYCLVLCGSLNEIPPPISILELLNTWFLIVVCLGRAGGCGLDEGDMSLVVDSKLSKDASRSQCALVPEATPLLHYGRL